MRKFEQTAIVVMRGGPRAKGVYSAALRNLKHIRNEDSARIISALEDLAGEPDPIRHVKKLRGLPFYSLRVGTYRAILAFKRGGCW